MLDIPLVVLRSLLFLTAGQHTLEGEKHAADIEDGAPFVGKDANAAVPVAVDVWVFGGRPAIGGQKDNLWRFERIVVWKTKADSKCFASIDGIGPKNGEGKAPLAQIVGSEQSDSRRRTCAVDLCEGMSEEEIVK